MWIPSWLWDAYSKLYSVFGEETFGFSGCKQVLLLDDVRTRVVVSRLRRAGHLVIFEIKGRKRSYRLVEPSLLTFADGVGLSDFSTPQGRYQNLVHLWCKTLLSHYGQNMTSIVLYGSVARGTATQGSDIDFLLIIDNLGSSYGARIKELVSLEADSGIAREKTFLRQKGYPGQLSNLVYSIEESKRFRWVYLDIIHEGLVLFDRRNHFMRLRTELKARMRELGTKRVVLNDGRWYWVLKPSLVPGERLDL